MEQDGNVSVYYSPFDFIRTSARIAIVGITPGAQQSKAALNFAHAALARGAAINDALRMAKDHASFAGAMRSNLVAMLDYLRVARWLDIPSTDTLWAEKLHLAHFTSVLRYPVFVNGKDYGGSSPDMLAHPLLARQIDTWFAHEMKQLPDALWVPLGDKVGKVLQAVAARNGMRARILKGLPHPSGANAERIAYFLGRKTRDALSKKTNAAKLDTARQCAVDTMQELLLLPSD
jgi:hypothetical protein